MMLKTTDAVIVALGGTGAVAKALGRKGSAVSNWRRFENFPPWTFLAFKALLDERGLEAAPELWRMVPAPAATITEHGSAV